MTKIKIILVYRVLSIMNIKLSTHKPFLLSHTTDFSSYLQQVANSTIVFVVEHPSNHIIDSEIRTDSQKDSEPHVHVF